MLTSIRWTDVVGLGLPLLVVLCLFCRHTIRGTRFYRESIKSFRLGAEQAGVDARTQFNREMAQSFFWVTMGCLYSVIWFGFRSPS